MAIATRKQTGSTTHRTGQRGVAARAIPRCCTRKNCDAYAFGCPKFLHRAGFDPGNEHFSCLMLSVELRQ
jgi:hypothetical protein